MLILHDSIYISRYEPIFRSSEMKKVESPIKEDFSEPWRKGEVSPKCRFKSEKKVSNKFSFITEIIFLFILWLSSIQFLIIFGITLSIKGSVPTCLDFFFLIIAATVSYNEKVQPLTDTSSSYFYFQNQILFEKRTTKCSI